MAQHPLAALKPANPDNDGRDAKRPPAAPYYHMWLDEGGRSHIERCEMRNFAMRSVGGRAAPQWLNALPEVVEAVVFAVQPVGWVGEWHESPKPHWVVPLSGRWFIQTQDGMRVEMGPGDIHFGEDQGSAPDADGNVGHLSGTVGDEPCVLMLIQLKTAPTRNRPCRFG
jgi:hypothetical protein